MTVSAGCERCVDLTSEPGDGTRVAAGHVLAQRVHQPQPGVGPEVLERSDLAHERRCLCREGFGSLPAANGRSPGTRDYSEFRPDIAAALRSCKEVGQGKRVEELSAGTRGLPSNALRRSIDASAPVLQQASYLCRSYHRKSCGTVTKRRLIGLDSTPLLGSSSARGPREIEYQSSCARADARGRISPAERKQNRLHQDQHETKRREGSMLAFVCGRTATSRHALGTGRKKNSPPRPKMTRALCNYPRILLAACLLLLAAGSFAADLSGDRWFGALGKPGPALITMYLINATPE